MPRLCWLLFVMALTSLPVTTGCSTFRGVRDYIVYNECQDEFVIGYRNQVWARQSWHRNKPFFVDQSYLHDFGEGYRAGYREVASGGSGCPPAVPPRCYWSWKYQTPEGQGKVSAWFSGYPHGAAAAEQDQAGEWMQIQVSHQVETQYSPEFQDGTIFLPDELREELVIPPYAVDPYGQPVDQVPPPAAEPEAEPAVDPQPDLPAEAMPLNGLESTYRTPDSLEPVNGVSMESRYKTFRRLPAAEFTSQSLTSHRPDLAFWASR